MGARHRHRRRDLRRRRHAFLDRSTFDLAVGWGRDTYWAPEIGWAAGQYHMYASMIRGVSERWEGHDRRIVHGVSDDPVRWRHVGPLELSSRRVIDACVARLPSATDGAPAWVGESEQGSQS